MVPDGVFSALTLLVAAEVAEVTLEVGQLDHFVAFVAFLAFVVVRGEWRLRSQLV